MSRIRFKDTAPERLVRSILHRAGLRFRKNVRTLAGKPDAVLTKHCAIVFVHGCFWHQHYGCKRSTVPKSNVDYWIPKLEGNKARDRRNVEELADLGWRVIIVWECETKDLDRLRTRLMKFFAVNGTDA